MWWILILLILAAAGYYFYTEKKTKDRDREVLKPPPWEAPGKVGLVKPVKKSPLKKTPPKTTRPPKAGPKPPPDKPAPKGWYRQGGFIFRNPDPKALWNASVARNAKRIDFALIGKVLPEQDLGNINLDRLAFNVFRMPDTDFSATMSLTSYLTKASMFLCDKSGKVYDYAIAAEGKYTKGVSISYKAGSFKGGPYVVQASDGISAGSTFSRRRGR